MCEREKVRTQAIMYATAPRENMPQVYTKFTTAVAGVGGLAERTVEKSDQNDAPRGLKIREYIFLLLRQT